MDFFASFDLGIVLLCEDQGPDMDLFERSYGGLLCFLETHWAMNRKTVLERVQKARVDQNPLRLQNDSHHGYVP